MARYVCYSGVGWPEPMSFVLADKACCAECAGPFRFKRTAAFRVYWVSIGLRNRFRLLARFKTYEEALRFCRDQYVYQHGADYAADRVDSRLPESERKWLVTKYSDKASKWCELECDYDDQSLPCLIISQAKTIRTFSLLPDDEFDTEFSQTA